MRTLVIAGLLLITATIALWALVVSEDEAPSVPPTVERSPTPQADAPAQEPVATTSARKTTALSKAVRDKPATVTPSITRDTPVVEAPPEKVRKVDPMRDSLREQLRATEGEVLECMDKAQAAAPLPDGSAAYGINLVKQNGKVVIDQTGVEYSAFPEPFNECLKATARSMEFDTFPDGVDKVIAFRKITIDKGELKRNTLSEYQTAIGGAPPQTVVP